jgi:hypothetical protein
MGRREFLSGLSAAVASGVAGSSASWAAERTPKNAPLPTIQLGKYTVTRLIAGWNPIGGYSYLGHSVDKEMKAYFTAQRTIDFLRRCEQEGINTHQYSMNANTLEVLRTLRQQGSKMQFLCLDSGREKIKSVIENMQPFAVAHHGGATDSLFRQGKSQVVHDYVKAAHDCGLLAGVSAHNPDCIKQVADEGWEVDFFMTCFYFLTRPKKSGPVEKPPAVVEGPSVGYSFYASDPLTMTQVARQVKQPCLGFKILAAGRLCANQQVVRQAFKFAFTHLKPIDGVIVGMYPQSFDQVRANAQYIREFAAPSPG